MGNTGTVLPKGTNNNSVNDYTYFDAAPAKGQNAYRNQKLSTTGKISFSRVVVAYGAGLQTLQLPNLPKGTYRIRAGERAANLLIQ